MNVDQHVDPSINNMIRQLQPKAVINNRGDDVATTTSPAKSYIRSISARRLTNRWGWKAGDSVTKKIFTRIGI